jgi:hypothetical protein
MANVADSDKLFSCLFTVWRTISRSVILLYLKHLGGGGVRDRSDRVISFRVRFEVFTAVTMKNGVFRVVTP